MSQGPVVEEVPICLFVGDNKLYEWRCTPADLEALAVGRLFVDGLACDGPIEIRGNELHVAATHSIRKGNVSPVETPPLENFNELFRTMFAGVDARHQEGGMHAAALARGDTIAFQAEDVGRHNAVDKVIGMALLANAEIAAHGMLVSSRVSGEIARKAANSTVAWLASRSLPTTLAVDIARTKRMPIIGRAASKNAFVYR